MSAPRVVIEVSGVCKTYGRGEGAVAAVKDLSFVVEESTCFGLLIAIRRLKRKLIQ